MLSFFHQPIPIHNAQLTIASNQPEATTSLIIRPTAKERRYAPSHLAAFENTRSTDSIHFCFFKASLASHHNQPSKSWAMAKRWWQELYGDCINENVNGNQANQITTTTLTSWIIQQLDSPHRTRELTPDSREFILNSYKKITQTNDISVFKEEKRKIRQHILKIHPDKNGDSSETAILIEWKTLIDEYKVFFIHKSKMPYHCTNNHTNTTAKPWIVYRLFLENQAAIERQIMINAAQSIKKTNIHAQDIINTNHLVIYHQTMTIRQLQLTIANKASRTSSNKLTNEIMPVSHRPDNNTSDNQCINDQALMR